MRYVAAVTFKNWSVVADAPVKVGHALARVWCGVDHSRTLHTTNTCGVYAEIENVGGFSTTYFIDRSYAVKLIKASRLHPRKL